MKNCIIVIKITFMILFVGAMTGCVSLNGNVPFSYINSLPVDTNIKANVGLEKMIDVRPKKDKKETRAITDIDEKITAKFLEDIKNSNLFSNLSYPVKSENNIILKGQVKRFHWTYSTEFLVYIPYVNLIYLFGLDAYKVTGEAEIEMQVIDANTKQVLKKYDVSSKQKEAYNIYDLKAGEAGAELADAFRDVTKKIRDKIATDYESGVLQIPQN